MNIANRPGDSRRRNAGFTLVEVLIGEALALLIISGLLAFLAPATAGLADARSNSDIQDSGRAGFQFLNNAIAFAGYQGCSSDTTHTSILAPIDGVASPRLRNWAYGRFGIRGFDANENDRIAADLGSAWRSQRYRFESENIGDILVVQNARGHELTLAGHNPEQYRLIFDGQQTDLLHAGQILQINDCLHSARLQIDSTTPPSYSALSDKTTVYYTPESPLNCSGASISSVSLGPGTNGGCHNADAELPFLTFSFTVGTRAHIVDSAVYFVGLDAATGSPALKRSGFANNAARIYTETLVTGVENLRIQFGVDVDADGVPDRYTEAAEISRLDDDNPGWENVVSVALWLMLRSTGKSEYANRTAPVVFPTVDGDRIDCQTRTPADAQNHIDQLLACPYSALNERQHDRYVMAGVINMENKNL